MSPTQQLTDEIRTTVRTLKQMLADFAAELKAADEKAEQLYRLTHEEDLTDE